MVAVSVIVPVLRDTPALVILLAQLTPMRPAPLETIVVDGAGDAQVAALCAAHGAGYLVNAPGRGAQLNAGARAARGEVLWFVHADSQLDPGSLVAIDEALATGARAGYFRFRFAGPRTLARAILERCIACRCRVGTAYGDQAIFVERNTWHAAGGFAAVPLFEEVALLRRLKSMGLVAALTVPIHVSARRWERDGWWRRTLMNRMLALGYILGIAPTRLARWYRRS